MSHLSRIPDVTVPVKHQDRRRPRFLTFLLVALSVSGVLFSGRIARSGEYEPIGLVSDSVLVAGEPLLCQVGLDGPSATVTIYSNPPGAVSFHGTLQSGAIVEADTAPNLTDGQHVTIYAVTDGQNVVATTTAVSSDNTTDRPLNR